MQRDPEQIPLNCDYARMSRMPYSLVHHTLARSHSRLMLRGQLFRTAN